MIYSCFNERLGLYEYFEDERGHPINGDLPVPRFTGTTQIGMPALEAGRPLPSGVKRTGTGWHARGIIVRCKPMAVKGLGQTEEPPILKVAFLLGVGAMFLYVAWGFFGPPERRRR